MLVRLIYYSEVARPWAQSDLDSVIASSQTKNVRQEISGCLWLDWHMIVQALEGPRLAINELYLKIAADPRHKNVNLVEFIDIIDRSYGDWSMLDLTERQAGEGIRLASGEIADFELQKMTANELGHFLKSRVSIAEAR